MGYEVKQTPVENEVDENCPEEPSHHVQAPLCLTRPLYRQGRRLTAIKVFTVASESQHLIISGVPAVGLQNELAALMSQYGDVKMSRMSVRNFCEKYHAQYANFRLARVAKQRLDEKNYYGGSLHICYAPEMETIAETRSKLMLRRHEVATGLFLMKARQKQAARRTQQQMLQQTQQQGATEVARVSVENPAEATKAEGTRKRKHAITNTIVLEKQYQPCFLPQLAATSTQTSASRDSEQESTTIPQSAETATQDSNQPVDGTSANHPAPRQAEKITLNYDKFGNEDIRVIPAAPVNKIRFSVARKQ